MDIEFLAQLAHQLRIGKTSGRHRAINWSNALLQRHIFPVNHWSAAVICTLSGKAHWTWVWSSRVKEPSIANE